MFNINYKLIQSSGICTLNACIIKANLKFELNDLFTKIMEKTVNFLNQ